jgi:hypothetical protein
MNTLEYLRSLAKPYGLTVGILHSISSPTYYPFYKAGGSPVFEVRVSNHRPKKDKTRTYKVIHIESYRGAFPSVEEAEPAIKELLKIYALRLR